MTKTDLTIPELQAYINAIICEDFNAPRLLPIRIAEQLVETMQRKQQALQREAKLRKALRLMIHESTHLSPMEDDGSHWCRITRESLEQARAAYRNDPNEYSTTADEPTA